MKVRYHTKCRKNVISLGTLESVCTKTNEVHITRDKQRCNGGAKKETWKREGKGGTNTN